MTDLTPKQVLVLWNLLFSGKEPKISELKPELRPGERKTLENSGLIEFEKRDGAKYAVLTEEAWAWASDHLTAPITRSPHAAIALGGLLKALQHHIDNNDWTLAEFMAPLLEEMETEDDLFEDLSERIRTAYLELTGGQLAVRVRLAELIEKLPGIDVEMLHQHLVGMQTSGQFGLVLWSLDDPREIGPEDERTAVKIAGAKRHILYLEH